MVKVVYRDAAGHVVVFVFVCVCERVGALKGWYLVEPFGWLTLIRLLEPERLSPDLGFREGFGNRES